MGLKQHYVYFEIDNENINVIFVSSFSVLFYFIWSPSSSFFLLSLPSFSLRPSPHIQLTLTSQFPSLYFRSRICPLLVPRCCFLRRRRRRCCYSILLFNADHSVSSYCLLSSVSFYFICGDFFYFIFFFFILLDFFSCHLP